MEEMKEKNEETAVLLNEACDYIQKSDFENAEKKLARLLAIDSNHLEGNKTMGLTLVNLDKCDMAVKKF